MNNKSKCPHGLDVDPVTGEHIFPSKTDTVIKQEEQKPEMDTATLIREAKRLFQKQEIPQTKQEKDLDIKKELRKGNSVEIIQ
jgi:hypothetical protein